MHKRNTPIGQNFIEIIRTTERDYGTTLPGGDAVIANDSIYYMLETAAKAAHGMLLAAFPMLGPLVCEKTGDIPNYPFRVGGG